MRSPCHGKHDDLWRTGECHAAFPLIATVTISSHDAKIHKAGAELSAEKTEYLKKDKVKGHTGGEIGTE